MRISSMPWSGSQVKIPENKVLTTQDIIYIIVQSETVHFATKQQTDCQAAVQPGSLFLRGFDPHRKEGNIDDKE
jgi:hypothetical protein